MSMRVDAALVVLLLAAPAGAAKISIATFSGPEAKVRSQVEKALCDAAECVSAAKVGGATPDWKKAKNEKVQFIVTGKTTKKSVEHEVLAAPSGKVKAKKSLPIVKHKISEEAVAAALGKSLGVEEEAP